MSTPNQSLSSSATSSGEQRYAGMDERKRMISNRDSARRSRMRKQKTVEEFTNEVNRLQFENSGIMGKIDEAVAGYMVLKAENNVLRAQAAELTERFRSMIGVLESTGLRLDVLDVPHPLLEPWQIRRWPSQTIMASLEFYLSCE